MSPKICLRIASLSLFFILLGHSTTFIQPVTHGEPEIQVFQAMKNFTFDMMGSMRSHHDFYIGYSVMMTIHLAMIGIILWILSNRTPQNLRELNGIMIALTVGTALYAGICWTNFFIAPAAPATLAAISIALAAALSRKVEA